MEFFSGFSLRSDFVSDTVTDTDAKLACPASSQNSSQPESFVRGFGQRKLLNVFASPSREFCEFCLRVYGVCVCVQEV